MLCKLSKHISKDGVRYGFFTEIWELYFSVVSLTNIFHSPRQMHHLLLFISLATNIMFLFDYKLFGL